MLRTLLARRGTASPGARPDPPRRSRGPRTPVVLAACALVTGGFALTTMAPAAPAAGSTTAARAANLLTNPGFEQVTGRPPTPRRWTKDVLAAGATLVADATQRHTGHRSVRITAPTANDARWTQTIAVRPGSRYRLSGWIRTSRVAHSAQAIDAGASLGILGRWEHTPAVLGTKGWTYVSLIVDSGADTSLVVAARLGFWSGTTSGTAWFDDLRLERLGATPPVARWKVLVLLYPKVDFRWTDADGRAQHVTSTMTTAQQQGAAAAARAFLGTDVPALTSGFMVPRTTVRTVSRTLTELDQFGEGWWPGPGITQPERDPAFDAVLVIWQPMGVDTATGEPRFIGAAAGLTYEMGTGQTYASMMLDAVVPPVTRNVFRHEFGHSLLWYFEAAGATPTPTVSNHTDETTYVHCGTGTHYVWTDETLADPIPNSIYNVASGFTHDYSSGTTALATDPDRCLGITREAWASGSPLTQRTSGAQTHR